MPFTSSKPKLAAYGNVVPRKKRKKKREKREKKKKSCVQNWKKILSMTGKPLQPWKQGLLRKNVSPFTPKLKIYLTCKILACSF